MNLYESVRNNLETFLANKDKITNWRLKYKGFNCYCGALSSSSATFRGEEPGYQVFDDLRNSPKEPLVRRTYTDIDLGEIDVDKFLKKVEKDLKASIDVKVGIKESAMVNPDYNKDLTERNELEKYWDAKEITRKGFMVLLKFDEPDLRGNNYIITLDANDVKRFVAKSDDEAMEEFNNWIEKHKGKIDYDFDNQYDKI